MMSSRLLVLFLLSGCVEYEVVSQVDHGLGGEDTGAVNPLDELMDAEPADAAIYANTAGRLFEIEPETGVVTTVGDFRIETEIETETGTETETQKVSGFVDIAIDPDGRMVGGVDGALYRIDPATAEVVWICDTDVDMTALAFTDQGDLVAGGDAAVVWLDPLSGEAEHLVESAVFETSGDLVGLPDGFLYWTVRGDDGDELVRIDPVGGATTWIGPIGVSALYGLGYDADQLYGFSADGEIVRISPVGAASQVIARIDDQSWWGATTNPVAWTQD